MLKGFVLGLSSGSICLVYCLPAIVPFLLTEGKKTRKNFLYLIEFMLGRLMGYILIGIVAFISGNMLIRNGILRELILSISYISLSVFMIIYVFYKSNKFCIAKQVVKTNEKFKNINEFYAAPIIGILTGLNLCPPFLLAFSDAASLNNIVTSVLYFIAFFIGTSIYFIPIPFIFTINNHKTQIIGKMACSIIAIYYMFTGIFMFAGGIKSL